MLDCVEVGFSRTMFFENNPGNTIGDRCSEAASIICDRRNTETCSLRRNDASSIKSRWKNQKMRPTVLIYVCLQLLWVFLGEEAHELRMLAGWPILADDT